MLACNNNASSVAADEKSKKQQGIATPESALTNNADSWEQNFIRLKQAIANGNREAIKSFVNFPINNQGNEIWYLANPELVMEIRPKPVKPFTANDFDQYFSSLFGVDFRKTMQALDENKLFENYNSTSEALEIVQGYLSTLKASFDKKQEKITLALETASTGSSNMKFTRFYYFDVINGKDITFSGVHQE